MAILQHKSTAGIAMYRPSAAPQAGSSLPRQAQGEGWHSGCSPHKYELVTLPSNVKKCYGCGQEFSDRLRQSPNNIVLKHIDCRLVRRDERTGNFLYSADYSNTYYHLDRAHILRKKTLFHRKGVHFFR